MADDNLDDFFAKKDKSKKKTKSSKLTPSDILAKSEESVKKEKKSKKDKDKTQSSNSSTITDISGLIVNPKEEEEWKEVEEEKEKDYSGLRIANLQIADKVEEGEEEGDENQDEDNEDGEGKERRDKGEQGPWKSGATTVPTAVQPEHPATPVEEPKKEEPKPTGKYVPPSQRAAAAAGGTTTPSGPTVPSHLRRKKEMPNLKSEEEFPTLGGNAPPIPVDRYVLSVVCSLEPMPHPFQSIAIQPLLSVYSTVVDRLTTPLR
ncbi:protein CDV3 homolog isoform X1 [Dreissena polymorpha]|uniref:protein CDV3 homolog isoform X1 n=1 Tax=Dreissena polymorpha TaxID=45954 RepID=UPI0022650D2A|nr:protein CDV3 homolog isoform X1 [Dreissena polymorpha]